MFLSFFPRLQIYLLEDPLIRRVLRNRGSLFSSNIISAGYRVIRLMNLKKNDLLWSIPLALGWEPQFNLRSGIKKLVEWDNAEREWAREILTP